MAVETDAPGTLLSATALYYIHSAIQRELKKASATSAVCVIRNIHEC